MAYFHKTMSLSLISFALVLASSLPSSLSQDDTVRENRLRDLCTDNYRPDQCWEIIKNNYDGFNTDDPGIIVRTAIDLARGKGVEILDQLNQLHDDSDNDELKEKYQLCANNYNDAIRDIDQAKSYLDSGNSDDISTQIHSALDDFEECRHSFDKGSFDPAHVLDRNHEFFVYAQLAKAAGEKNCG